MAATQEQPETIKLISSDGEEFIVDKSIVLAGSNTLNSMLSNSGDFEESGGEITLREINGKTLEIVIQYFYFKKQYANATGEIPEFKVTPDDAIPVLLAANFLDC